ncbi:hypothetical protein BA190_08755 [Labrys sp. WJW]|nr:hypothetical protein BA190_08755 [Labrys sp. WJW]
MNVVALTEIAGYRDWVGTPALSSATIELGLRTTPNLEMLAQVVPDVVFVNETQKASATAIESIAPCVSASIFSADGHPYLHAQRELSRLAAQFGRGAEACFAIEAANRAIIEAKAAIGGFDRPLYLARFVDPRHLMVFGAGSLFQDVLDGIDLRNAWRGQTSAWGFTITGVDALAADRDAHLIYLGLGEKELQRAEAESAIWRNLPFIRQRRVSVLPGLWFFGAVASAERFARAIGQALG